MPKNKNDADPNDAVSQLKSYARLPIRHKAENKEFIKDEESEEEVEEEDLNLKEKSVLYPNLKEELYKLHKSRKSKECEGNSKTYKQVDAKSDPNTKQFSKPIFKYIISILDLPIFRYIISILGSPNFKYIISTLVFLVAVITSYFFYAPKKASGQINAVADLVDNMKVHFKDQESRTFKILDRALTRVFNVDPEPSAPAIFTVIADKGAEKTASDFSMFLANAIAPGQFVSINKSIGFHNNPEKMKFIIDKEIKSKVEKEILNVVIVDRLNDIPIDAAMIFHGFCDHEYASYKRVVYLFIVHISKRIPANSKIDSVAMDSLRSIWSTSTDDKVDSLITRLTVNVINIK